MTQHQGSGISFFTWRILSALSKVRIGAGFTLAETVIVIGITVFALAALVSFFLTFNSTYGYETAFVAAAGSNSAIMSALPEAILPAKEVLAAHDFSGTTYVSSGDTLVLKLPAIDTGGALVPDEYDYVAFYAEGTVLYQRTEAAAESARQSGRIQLSQNLDSASFSYDTADFANVSRVTAAVQTRAAYKEQAIDMAASGTWFLRNKQPAP